MGARGAIAGGKRASRGPKMLVSGPRTDPRGYGTPIGSFVFFVVGILVPVGGASAAAAAASRAGSPHRASN